MDGGTAIATAEGIKPACLWCEAGFEPRKGGSPQRFCNSKCRDAFHSAGRRWAEHAVLSGLLTAADLRNSPREACTLLTDQGRRSDYPKIRYEETALSDAQRAFARDTVLGVPINAEGVIALCWLGWLDPDQLRNRAAVTDAVVELTNAAISLRLRPRG